MPSPISAPVFRNTPRTRGLDVRLMRLGESFLIVHVLLQLASILRLIGIENIPAIALTISRTMDFILVFFFLVLWKKRIELRGIELILLVIAAYPILIGLGRDQINVTFFNDSALYIFFILKIIIYRSLISSIIKRYDLGSYFQSFLAKFIPISTTAAAIAFLAGQFFSATGQLKYYQTPAEITLTAAVALAYNKFFLFLFLALFAATSGKRMIMAGVLTIAAFAAVTSRRAMKIFLRWLPRFVIGGAIGAIILMLSGHLDGLAFANKISTTYEVASDAFSKATSLDNFFQQIEPARYVEFVSLRDQINGLGVLFGNGYGFRYELEKDLLMEYGFDTSTGSDISNAHFTPIAIVSKFGLLGLIVWSTYFLSILLSGMKNQKQNRFQYACTLALASYLVQSLFAFGFFINLLVPFVLAVISTKVTPTVSTVKPIAAAPDTNQRLS